MEMSARGCSFNDNIHQMIWSCSFMKWISSHAFVFSYGDQIRKISTCQNRRKFFILHTKDKEKMASVLKGLSDACMAWHGIDDDVA